VGKNVFTNETQKMIAGLSEQIGPIYTVSPMGTTLEKGALISIGLDRAIRVKFLLVIGMGMFGVS
jgi:hypothetical protein